MGIVLKYSTLYNPTPQLLLIMGAVTKFIPNQNIMNSNANNSNNSGSDSNKTPKRNSTSTPSKEVLENESTALMGFMSKLKKATKLRPASPSTNKRVHQYWRQN